MNPTQKWCKIQLQLYSQKTAPNYTTSGFNIIHLKCAQQNCMDTALILHCALVLEPIQNTGKYFVLVCIVCMTWHSFRNVIPVDMNVFNSDSKTDLRPRWNCIRISRYSRVPKALLLPWWLYVACYYPKTPTDYPSTTTGMCVGTFVAVNIEIYGSLNF